VVELLAAPWEGGPVSVCLFNGAGGGLGDAIMAGAAIRCLAERLHAHTGAVPQLDVFSIFPARATAVLLGIPGIRVLPLRLSLARFGMYDGVADCSGLVQDPEFGRLHMTDCFLKRLGIEPDSVAPAAKRPRLEPLAPSPAVAGAVAAARERSAGRQLVALVFRSALTRTMPDHLAARLLGMLRDDGFQPVIFMDTPAEAARFLHAFHLTDTVVDLSPTSIGFREYIALLGAMDGIVSVDTSAVHIGAALGKPVVAIFNSIAKDLRIRYSPTVIGIQIAYHGRTCTAPCNRSKGLAEFQGTLPGGVSFGWRFGYACEEAVDSATVLEAAKQHVARIDSAAPIEPQLEAVHRELADAFASGSRAPCWEHLDLDAVRTAIGRLLNRNMPGDRGQQ